MSDFKVWRIIPLSMVTTCEEERDKWIAAGHEVVELVSIDRIKQLEQELAAMTDLAIIKDRAIDLNLKELAEAKKDQARYQFLRNRALGVHKDNMTVIDDFESVIDAAIKESSK